MKKAICKNCILYKAVYTRGYFVFWKQIKGLCLKSRNIVEENEKCVHFNEQKEQTTTLSALDIAIEDIKTLQDIYKNYNNQSS